jgi:hypothetical protein
MHSVPPDDERLRHLLREWHEVPAPDAALASRVALDVGRSRPTPGSPLGALLEITWPRLALAGIAAGAVFGAAATEWRLRQQLETEMPARYREWIAPAQTAQVGTPQR